jgi:hypothetical protein
MLLTTRDLRLSASDTGVALASSLTSRFSDLLGKVWADKIEFERLDLASPAKIPAGPLIVVDDNIGFTRQS